MLDQGVLYKRKRYRSLSDVARLITKTDERGGASQQKKLNMP